MTEQRREKQNQKYKEKNFRNSRGCDCDSSETENCCDERDDEKSQCTLQHSASSKNVLDFLSSEIYWAIGLRPCWLGAIIVPFHKKSCMSFYFCTMYRSAMYAKNAEELRFLWFAHSPCK